MAKWSPIINQSTFFLKCPRRSCFPPSNRAHLSSNCGILASLGLVLCSLQMRTYHYPITGVIWYNSVCLVSITGQQLNQWLNRFRLLQGASFFLDSSGGKCSFVYWMFHLNKSVQPFFIDAVCHKPPEHYTTHFPTISCPSYTLLY